SLYFNSQHALNRGTSEVRGQSFFHHRDYSLCLFYRSSLRSPALLSNVIAFLGEAHCGLSRLGSDNRCKGSATTEIAVGRLSIVGLSGSRTDVGPSAHESTLQMSGSDPKRTSGRRLTISRRSMSS